MGNIIWDILPKMTNVNFPTHSLRVASFRHDTFVLRRLSAFSIIFGRYRLVSDTYIRIRTLSSGIGLMLLFWNCSGPYRLVSTHAVFVFGTYQAFLDTRIFCTFTKPLDFLVFAGVSLNGCFNNGAQEPIYQNDSAQFLIECRK